jgi:hypothetical protein
VRIDAAAMLSHETPQPVKPRKTPCDIVTAGNAGTIDQHSHGAGVGIGNLTHRQKVGLAEHLRCDDIRFGELQFGLRDPSVSGFTRTHSPFGDRL